jgi:hypothetical protein
VQLIVNDGSVDSEPDTVTVAASEAGPPNRAPLGDAGLDRVVATGESVTLDGSGSLDPEGAQLAFQWTLASVPADSSASLQGADTPGPSFIADRAGLYEAHLTVTDPEGATGSADVLITALAGGAGIAVSITEPVHGSTLEGDRVRVAGTVSGAGNIGVTVNGIIASVYAGQFVVDAMPLSVGENVITATASVIGGRATTAAVTVYSNATSTSLVLDAVPAVGVAPLEVALHYRSGVDPPLQTITMDYGDGTPEVTSSDPNVALEHTYVTPGLFRARLRVVGADDGEAVAERSVLVEDPALRDLALRELWSAMNNALSSGETTRALSFLTRSARRRYAPVFAALGPFMPGIVASYSPVTTLSLSGSIGEYALKRTIGGEDRLFLVYFVQDRDGVWRLGAM